MHAGRRRERALLMVVDGWTSGVLAESMARGELPTLARLVVAGCQQREGSPAGKGDVRASRKIADAVAQIPTSMPRVMDGE